MSNRVTKTCVACGLEKPLSAYLQISGPQGSSYGNICATCRGSGFGKKVVIPPAEDEHSSSSTGLKIDAKKKVQLEREKRQNIQRVRDLEHKESKKRESVTDEKNERIERTAESEQKHRDEYIEVKKKDSFLNNYQHKKSSPSQAPRGAHEKAITSKSFLDHSNRIETQKQENIKIEEKAKSVDLTDAPHGAEIKYQSEAFLRFIDERMAGTAIHSARRQFNHKKNHTEQKQASATEEKDQLIDFINDNWKPGSRR